MDRRPTITARVALSLAAAAIAALVVEGGSSLLRGRGVWLARGESNLDDWVVAWKRDADRFAAAARLEGIYKTHIDPFVRYTCRAAAGFEIRGVPVTTDELGMRKRPGAPPPEDALRVAVVGDSVAFGYGVRDDETLAARLEHHLNAAPAAPDSRRRPVACFTIASPGWNLRQSLRFLETHADAIRPDVVVLLPMNNDLYDADDVAESGHRFLSPDPAQREPLLLASANAASFLVLGSVAQRRARLGLGRDTAQTGPEVMTAGLSRESRDRYRVAAELVAALERRLTSAGGSLVRVRYVEEAFARRFDAALADLGVTTRPFRFFSHVARELTLGDDPHPNASTLDGMAHALSRVIGRAVFDPAFEPPPMRFPESFTATRIGADPSADESETLAAIDEAELRKLQPVFDPITAEGARQSYGGVNPDGTLGIRAKLALARAGGRVRIVLRPLPDRPDLAANAVEVFADGVAIGTVATGAGVSDDQATLELPTPADPRVVEIDLVAKRYGVTSLAGASQVASVRIVRIEVLPD